MLADIDPGVLWELTRSRHSEFLRQAATDHLSDRASLHGPSLADRLTLALADRLIALGVSLRRRYDCQPGPAALYGRSQP